MLDPEMDVSTTTYNFGVTVYVKTISAPLSMLLSTPMDNAMNKYH